MGVRSKLVTANHASPLSKEFLRESRGVLRAEFDAHGNAQILLRKHKALIDRLLSRAWRQCQLKATFALIAVGGYGRGELFPASDVDILILLPEGVTQSDESSIEKFIGCLWDIGLEVGHSVRTLGECLNESAKDITVQTSLLEARLITGSRVLFRELSEMTREAFDGAAFLVAKRLEQEQRHAKFQETPYSLEPNIKEAPGGLRDIQVVRWIGRAIGAGNTWKEFADKGLITSLEARQFAIHERTLTRLRVLLHYLTGRREDRLLFDYQGTLAARLQLLPAPGRRASEVLMEKYYRTAKAVTQLNTITLQNLATIIVQPSEANTHRLNDRFQVDRELLDINSDDLFDKQPESILESFRLMQQHPELKGMTARTLRALWRTRMSINDRFRRNPVNKTQFLELFQQPRGIVHELRRMNQYSILGRYLPAFGKIVGQMQHDLFHVYTVDQHILMVIRNLRRFTMVEFAHEYPLCSRLMVGFDRHWLLYIAALFHDIAKGRGGDHSELGVADAAKFCKSHGLVGDDSSLVLFLVRHHLDMSAIAQKQDLSDNAVVDRFAELVGNERQLIALYLLTVADIRGTSPKVWNAWKGKLLEDLYNATRRRLAGAPSTSSEDILAKQEEARRLLRLYALSDGVETELWRQLDVPYFLRHDAADIAWQTRLLFRHVAGNAPMVKARLSPVGEGLQVMIYSPDQPFLFARICSYFETLGFSIVDAKIYTTKHGYALDMFQVLGTGSFPDYRDMIRLIEVELAEKIARQASLPVATQGRISRQLRHFPITPEVHINADEKGRYFALSIIAGDRPGLLYRLATVLGQYSLNLHTAKIATLGERAEDTFVISGEDLSHPRTVLRLEQAILAALQA